MTAVSEARTRPTGAPRDVVVSRIGDVRTTPLASLTVADAGAEEAGSKKPEVDLAVAAFNSTI